MFYVQLYMVNVVWSVCNVCIYVFWHVLYPMACWPDWIYGIQNKVSIYLSDKLHNDNTLAGWAILQVRAIEELLEVSLRNTYFQWKVMSAYRNISWL
jgi:hypothetical protein